MYGKVCAIACFILAIALGFAGGLAMALVPLWSPDFIAGIVFVSIAGVMLSINVWWCCKLR